MKQTAVEFLHSEYKKIFGDTLVDIQIGFKISDVFEQAKEMEKQQIIDSYASGYIDGVAQNKITAEQYYNETFKKE
jgi:hypothetical protein